MPEREIQKRKSPIVVHSNDLIIKTANDFGANQLKLFFYILSQIPRDADRIPAVSVEIGALVQLLNLDTKDSGYRWHIKNTLDDLATRLIYVVDRESNLYRMTWFDYIRQDESGDHYLFQLKKVLEPFILRLNRDFTRYQFAYLLEFKSSYAIKLYDYFQSSLFRQTVILTLDEFRLLMGLKRFDSEGNIVADKYPTYDNIAKKVIKPALDEINEKSDITVTFKAVKSPQDGRKIGGVQFVITLKDTPPVYDYVIPPSAKASPAIPAFSSSVEIDLADIISKD